MSQEGDCMDRAPFANAFGRTIRQGQKTMALCIILRKKSRHDLRIFPCSAVYFLGTGLGTREARTFSVKIRTMQKPCSRIPKHIYFLEKLHLLLLLLLLYPRSKLWPPTPPPPLAHILLWVSRLEARTPTWPRPRTTRLPQEGMVRRTRRRD